MWRPVVGFEMYEVSEAGEIRRCKPASVRHPVTGRILKTNVDPSSGYRKIGLHDGLGRQITKAVHVLVCEAFKGPRPVGLDVRHLDGNKANNHARNLAYGTRTENNLDAVDHGTNFNTAKTHCPLGHDLADPNLYRHGGRNCRACGQARAAGQRARRQGLAFDFKAAADAAYQRILLSA